MKKDDDFRRPRTDPSVPNGGREELGRYSPGAYQKEAREFFKACVGEETYDRAMSMEAGRRHHYVAARAFLQQRDWEKFCWIEQHGSLEDYPYED